MDLIKIEKAVKKVLELKSIECNPKDKNVEAKYLVIYLFQPKHNISINNEIVAKRYNLHRTNVYAARKQVKNWIDTDKNFREKVEKIKELLK